MPSFATPTPKVLKQSKKNLLKLCFLAKDHFEMPDEKKNLFLHTRHSTDANHLFWLRKVCAYKYRNTKQNITKTKTKNIKQFYYHYFDSDI